jgi:hypothetical protein
MSFNSTSASMETEARMPERDVTDETDAGLDTTWVDDRAGTRSAQNIAAWRSYLPADCVAAMVRMGWDYST